MKTRRRSAAAFALALSLAFGASALAEPFDPRAYQDRVVGEPTQILVLATPHLSGTPEGWDENNLAPLLDRLAEFRPAAILIETLSGESIDALQRYRTIYPKSATTYAGHTIAVTAMASVGVDMDMAQAEAEVRRVLTDWPAEPSPAQRRRLAALFAASGNPHSALVQWWRLPPADRIAEDGVTTRLMNAFNEYDARKNENHQIAARLAARLGLERVYATDDHAADDVGEQFWKDFEAMHDAGWGDEIMANQAFVPLREAAQNLNTPDQLMATYRMLNSDAVGRIDADGQWLSMMTRATPNGCGPCTRRVLGKPQSAPDSPYPRSERSLSRAAFAGDRRLGAQALVRCLSEHDERRRDRRRCARFARRQKGKVMRIAAAAMRRKRLGHVDGDAPGRSLQTGRACDTIAAVFRRARPCEEVR
jgi:hypothetical protein